MKKKSLILIMARKGGTDSVSRQNMRLVKDKPLIDFVIQTVLKIYNVEIFITTDSEEIKEYALMKGIQIIHRPTNLTKNNTSIQEIAYHAIKNLEKKGKTYEKCLVLHPKFPLIHQNTIMNFFKYLNHEIETVFGITEIIDSKLNYILIRNSKTLPKLIPSEKNTALLNRIVSFKVKKFLKNRGKFIQPFYGFHLPINEQHDISSYNDFRILEQILDRKKILVRVNASVAVGLGHVYNMLTILNHLRNQEILVVMNKNKNGNIGSRKFKEQLYNVKLFLNDKDLEKIIADFSPDIIFNDILNTPLGYMKKLKKYKSLIVNFEDIGNGRKYADLVFNPIFNKKKPLTNEFYGGRYACVRDEFRIWSNNSLRQTVKKILISFGGTDPVQITTKILHIIQKLSLKEIEYTIILGYGFRHKNQIKKNTRELVKKGFKIKIVEKSDFLAKHIRQTDFAIISNGRTVFEVACMKVPVLSIAVNEREKSHSFVKDNKIGKHMIYEPNSFSDKLSINVQHMLKYENRKKYKSNLGKFELLDGVERVIKIINDEYVKKL